METPITTIDAAQARHRVRLRGVIQSITYSPSQAPARLSAVLSDGTGSIELRWPGKRDIFGMSVGDTVEVEGTTMPTGDQLVLIYPIYNIVLQGDD